MMKKSGFIVGAGLVLGIALGAGQATASELVFGFDNPSFGGNPFMGRHLLDTANSINTHKAPTKPPGLETPELSEAELFSENLRRQVLNRLARTIVNSAFGETGLQPGVHTIGDNSIEVIDDGLNVTVIITDLGTGAATTVTVPRF